MLESDRFLSSPSPHFFGKMKRTIDSHFVPQKKARVEEAGQQLLTDLNPERIDLSEKSWVDVYKVPNLVALSEEEFEDLWNLRPAEKGKIKMFGKMVTTPRWSQTFGHSYYFSGVLHESKPMTPVLSRLMEWCKGRSPSLNGCLVNWYENGADYIGPHSDSESSIVPESEIYSLSFGSPREFVFHPKAGGPTKSVTLWDKTLVVMCGLTQKTHKHSVPARKVLTGRRINVTFRSFNKQ
jgi:alkylated DNA repair dioxygenase AlkB